MTEKHITSEELFERIADITKARNTLAARMIHETLSLACNAGLRGTGHNFGNLSSKVDMLCRKHNMKKDDIIAVKRARVHSNSEKPLEYEEIMYDCRALSLFVSAVFNVSVPDTITGKIPQIAIRKEKPGKTWTKYKRCIVKAWDEQGITVETDDDSGPMTFHVAYTDQALYSDHSYLKDLLQEGMQLNLLGCRDNNGTITAEMIVVEPDYLMDTSSIANCFEDFGHHPLTYTLNRMKQRANTQHTLLGNFAGRALDEIVYDNDCKPSEILKTNFKEKALEYATCQDFNPVLFKTQAIQQVGNIKQCAAEMFRDYNKGDAILEPSFVCEKLGLYGRVDLMTIDKSLLVEQKAGKNIFIERGFRNRHGSLHMEKHYVQVLLYYGILRNNFNLPEGYVNLKLLYSRYPLPSGLVEVEALKKLLKEAIVFRNRVVAQEFEIAQKGFENVFELLTPENLNTASDNSFFYNRYLKPQIEAVTAPLHTLDDTEKAYFCRMMTFVVKEQLLAKIGGENGLGNCAADMWNMPLQEKIETGNIYTGMTIERMGKSKPGGGYDSIELSIPEQDDDFLPNFRRGDMVYLYSYNEGTVPDVRRSILLKGVISEIRINGVEVRLNDGQHNTKLFEYGNRTDSKILFAMEHGNSDSNATAAVRALHELATASKDRRALLLSRREPTKNAMAKLTRSYNKYYDEVLLKAKQANDFFLVIGPPGSGKTSMAMRYIVEEQLTGAPDKSILITSFTNRAVDEICGMLQSAGIDFLRIGNEFSCDAQYRNNLMEHMVETCQRLELLKAKIAQAKVIVGTTSTLNAKPFIFEIKHFALAVVDEAGQITEPNIIGLLASHAKTNNATQFIDKFILIGDYKQLPAVVQQDEKESTVGNPLLNAIGLRNCRDSLMERLVRNERRAGRKDYIGVLQRQGRMHPDIAEFPNSMFYHEEQLKPVPCLHQQEENIGYSMPARDHIDKMLKKHRMLYIPSRPCNNINMSEKVNCNEARIVAEVLARIKRMAGKEFDPEKSVGVIVPYRNQIAMIQREMTKLGFEEPQLVSIDTVERYQGSQRDIIIYSLTVHRRYQLDFLTANRIEENGRLIDRKLNVALTRARKQMIITGNPQILNRDPLFKNLISYISRKKGLLEINQNDTSV